MAVHNFPISLGFRGIFMPYYGPGGSIAPFHHGEDYACPSGTDLVIDGVKVADSGATGTVTGAHCHVDKRPIGADINNRYSFVDPGNWWTISGAKVVFAGWSGSAGNLLSIQHSGYEYRFLHLSAINKKVGDVIKGVVMLSKQMANVLYRFYLGRAPSDTEISSWVGKKTADQLETALRNGSTFAGRVEKVKNPDTYDITNHLPSALRATSILYNEYERLKAEAVATYEPYTLPQLFVKK